MGTIFIFIIITSCVINAYTDVLMMSGARIKHTFDEIVQETPDKHLYASGYIGVFAISQWMLVLYFLSHIKESVGIITMIAYAMYIGSIMMFHIACSYSFLLEKHEKHGIEKFRQKIVIFALPSAVFAAFYTGMMIYLGTSGILKINFFQYLTLPAFSLIFFQLLFGTIVTKGLIRIRLLSDISSTLAMSVSMLSTINIISVNFQI